MIFLQSSLRNFFAIKNWLTFFNPPTSTRPIAGPSCLLSGSSRTKDPSPPPWPRDPFNSSEDFTQPQTFNCYGLGCEWWTPNDVSRHGPAKPIDQFTNRSLHQPQCGGRTTAGAELPCLTQPRTGQLYRSDGCRTVPPGWRPGPVELPTAGQPAHACRATAGTRHLWVRIDPAQPGAGARAQPQVAEGRLWNFYFCCD
jgi:hypothetical protein